MKENMNVRNKLMRSGVRHWECAAAMGVSEQTFVRWLRFPLPKEKEERILETIERLAKGEC